MRIHIQFDNGGRIFKDCSSADEARGYVAGASAAAEHCHLQVWVADAHAADPTMDEGAWSWPDVWLEDHPSTRASEP